MDRLSLVTGSGGFTLVELLVVLVLAVVVVAAGGPALQRLVAGNRVEIESRRLLSALQLARSEAVSGNTVVSVCPTAMPGDGELACGGSYADGWVVFADPGAGGAGLVAPDRVIRLFESLPAGYRFRNRRGTRDANELISFRPDGTASRNLTLQVCPPDTGLAQPVSVVLSMIGRARLQRGWGTCRVF
jgi:prepilin-type N-terminal cleavage/methylation domain-containing protein